MRQMLVLLAVVTCTASTVSALEPHNAATAGKSRISACALLTEDLVTKFDTTPSHLRHSGARPADVVNTRAIVSVAWVAGPSSAPATVLDGVVLDGVVLDGVVLEGVVLDGDVVGTVELDPGAEVVGPVGGRGSTGGP